MGNDMHTELKQWAVVAAALSLGLLLTGGAVAFASDAQTTSNAEFQAAKAWLFAPEPKPTAPPPDAHKPRHVPGSTRTYSLAQETMFEAADWFPQDHAPMPHVVAHGRKPAWACAVCHLPDGEGAPASASLAGLPKAYILEQLHAFRSGQRIASVMNKETNNASDVDLEQAAAYFSKRTFKPMTTVIETTTVPKTLWKDFLLVPVASGKREPIGERIIETSNDFAGYVLGNERIRFVAYVPPGSMERGAVIAAKGVGTAPACESCHGADLGGVGNIPRLAGRSPTYIVRELVLFKTGGRTNVGAAPMRAEAAHLSLQDMIAVAAYAASRKS
jgi:cytochrome c553